MGFSGLGCLFGFGFVCGLGGVFLSSLHWRLFRMIDDAFECGDLLIRAIDCCTYPVDVEGLCRVRSEYQERYGVWLMQKEMKDVL